MKDAWTKACTMVQPCGTYRVADERMVKTIFGSMIEGTKRRLNEMDRCISEQLKAKGISNQHARNDCRQTAIEPPYVCKQKCTYRRVSPDNSTYLCVNPIMQYYGREQVFNLKNRTHENKNE